MIDILSKTSLLGWVEQGLEFGSVRLGSQIFNYYPHAALLGYILEFGF